MKKRPYPINKLSKQQFSEGADKALVNACEKLEAAKLICDKHPATAVSILITSLEELAKALYLKVQSHEPKKIHIEQLEKIFYSHQRKHEAVGIMYGALIIRKNSHLAPEVLTIMLISIGVLLASVLTLTTHTPGNGHRNLEFARKRGLYLDLDKESCEWISPQEYKSPEEVKEYVNAVNILLQDIKDIYFSGDTKNLEELVKGLSDESVKLKN